MHGDAFSIKRFRRGTAPLSQLNVTENAAIQTDADYDDVMEIPLPTELPQAPNLSRLPAEVLHSGTVETLIAHNEDLIARLKVNLRRNASLEQNIIVLEKELAETRRLSETLEDQVHIIKERDRLNREKTDTNEDRVTALRHSLDFAKAQAQAAYAQADADRNRLLAFNRRINRWVKPGFKRAMKKIDRDQAQAREFIHHTDLLRSDLAARDIEVAELTKQVGELRAFQRERERNFQKDQTNLTEIFESKISDLRKENSEISMQLGFFRDRAALVDEMTKRSADTENRAIRFERQVEALESIQAKFRDETEEQRREASRLSTQVEILRDEMRRSREENERLASENERNQDQLASLQILWAQGRKDAESMELRLQALTQVNQELSRNMKQNRLLAETEALELRATEQFQITGNEHAIAKIDSLLSSIELGFPTSRASRRAKLSELEFVETKETRHSPPGAEV